MTARQRIALGIADALLAGECEATSARLRCERALASRARWIGRLARQIVAQFADNWRDTARHEMAKAIVLSQAFDDAWRGRRPPRLRRFPLTPPRMSALPRALIDCVVPDLPTPRDIAQWLNLSDGELAWLTGPLQHPRTNDARHSHYNHRWLPKRSGGLRLLEIPKAQLCAVQHRVLRGLLEYVPPHQAAHGFRQRHSCITNARPHVGQAVVVRMDLEDFFGHVGGGKVYELFAALGYPAAAARTLTRLTTCATPRQAPSHAADGARAAAWHARKRLASPHLPQGAPTSPALANLCAFNFDVRVQALADSFGAQYTRYADDLTFSGNDMLARRVQTFAAHVAAIALDEGFRVNHRKTRVMRAATRQQVTGIVVNRVPNLPREHFDQLKATLHNCLRQGPASQCPAGMQQFRNHLAGHIAQYSAIHSARGARLLDMFMRIAWDDAV